MAVAGTASLFRIDTTGQTETTAEAAGNTVEFNGGTTPDAKSFLETARAQWVEDISEHPNPKKALNNLQDGLLKHRELVLTGWFEDPNNASGIAKLGTFMKDAKTNASLPFGRFGVRIDDISVWNQTPSASVGYILYDVDIHIPEDHPYEANFTIKLWMNGTHP
jgi:hypothetical protein